MAKKTGICKNIDCKDYKKEIEVEPGGEFECPSCHQTLKEEKGRIDKGKDPDKKKKIMIACGLVIAAAAIGGVVMSLGGDKSKDNTPIEQPKTSPTEVDTTAVSPPIVDTPKKDEVQPKPTTPQPQNGRGTVDLGYGTYTGELKNGKPHGHGIITYKSSQKIVSSKEFVANPGDTFEGEFRDGKISGLGYWEHDGNQTAVKP